MPIYEYECQTCHRVEEVFQKFSDPPLERCSCGGEMKKLMSPNTFHLKGSGWYVTDYGHGHGPSGGTKGNGAKTETASASESKAEKSSSAD